MIRRKNLQRLRADLIELQYDFEQGHLTTDEVIQNIRGKMALIQEADKGLYQELDDQLYKEIGELVPRQYLDDLLTKEYKETELNQDIMDNMDKSKEWHLLNQEGKVIDSQLESKLRDLLVIFTYMILK